MIKISRNPSLGWNPNKNHILQRITFADEQAMEGCTRVPWPEDKLGI